MTEYLAVALVTEEVVAGRPATVSWDSALLSAVPDAAGRREIIRLIGLEEVQDETRDFYVCYPFKDSERGWDWFRCVSGFTAQTGVKHFELTYQKDKNLEPLDVDDFWRWASEVGKCEPELSEMRLGQYRRWKEWQKEAQK